MKFNNNKTIFWTILFIIFAFNIAVAGTIVYYFVSHRVVFENIKQEEIKGNFHELKAFKPEIHNKYRNNIKSLNDENRELRIKFLEELIKPEPDYDSLKIMSGRIQDITQKISVNFYNEMVEMRKNLSVEEAQQFYGHQINMLKKRFDPPKDGETMGLPMGPPERGPREWEGQDQRRNRWKDKKSE